MDLNLTSKTAVVTGAGRGIGLSIVETLIGEGMRVIGATRTLTPELKDSGAHPVTVDLATTEGAQELRDVVADEFGTVDVLVNNVGGADLGNHEPGGFLSVTDAEWMDAFELNFLSAVRVTRALVPLLLQQTGNIVNISSVAARMPVQGPISYNMAKASLTALGKALMVEFGPRGLRVNTVSPGPVHTRVWDSPEGFGAALAKRAGAEFNDFMSRLPGVMGISTGRLTHPHEVASVVAFLASSHAANISGCDYIVDGGLVKTV